MSFNFEKFIDDIITNQPNGVKFMSHDEYMSIVDKHDRDLKKVLKEIKSHVTVGIEEKSGHVAVYNTWENKFIENLKNKEEFIKKYFIKGL